VGLRHIFFAFLGRAGRDFKGVVEIDNEKRLNWHNIRGEYISGGISLREIAEKYGISFSTVQKRCQREKWTEAREKAKVKVAENVVQKTAETVADNAVIAANIKRKALLILERLFDEYALSCTERRITVEGVTEVTRLRDLTAAYKEVTGDIQPDAGDSDILKSLLELEKRFK
jgi:DNA-binding Lrp family transcriptional regulator